MRISDWSSDVCSSDLVHQHYTKDALVDASAKKFTAIDLAAQQQIAGVLAEYIAMMGVDGRFLSRAASAGPTDIYRFSTTEMAAYAITWDEIGRAAGKESVCQYV